MNWLIDLRKKGENGKDGEKLHDGRLDFFCNWVGSFQNVLLQCRQGHSKQRNQFVKINSSYSEILEM